MKNHNTLRRCLAALTVIFAAFSNSSRGNSARSEPSPKDLIALAKRIDSGTHDVKSVEARIMARLGAVGVAARARVEHAGPSWLVVSDQFDGTPILVCAGGRAIIYDLERGTVHFFESADFEALAYFANGRIGVDYALSSGPSRILIDIPSLLSVGSENPSASHTGGNWILQANTRRGGLMVAAVLPDKAFPYDSIRLYAKGERQPVIAVDGVEVNQPARGPSPEIPGEATLATKLRVIRTAKAAVEPAARQDEVATMIKTLAYRVALREPAARADADEKYGPGIDWTAIRARDRSMSAELRELTGLNNPGRADATTQPTQR